ncbi:MAG: hypothetical protein ACOX5R_04050 [bacterium]
MEKLSLPRNKQQIQAVLPHPESKEFLRMPAIPGSGSGTASQEPVEKIRYVPSHSAAWMVRRGDCTSPTQQPALV